MNDLSTLWQRRTAGRSTCCDCGSALLLQVGAISYRWRCRACGRPSARFVVQPGGRIQVVSKHDPAFAREHLFGDKITSLLLARPRRIASGA